MDTPQAWIEIAASGIELLAVAVIVGFILAVTLRWLVQMGRRSPKAFERYRADVGRSLLVGLELLVAADIIRTVALDASLTNVGILAALVLIRTFLGWTLTIDIEGRWPWQRITPPPGGAGASPPNA
ncbi:MAG: DUF1622 domain-containing protein [Azospirillaceae bacterium]